MYLIYSFRYNKKFNLSCLHHEARVHPANYLKPPLCAVDRPWCVEDVEYPAYEIHAALQYHYEGVQAIYKDVNVNIENSV